MGLALGYPEKAARFYRERALDESLTWLRVCVDFCGIEFVCNFEDLSEIVYNHLLKLPIPEFEDHTVTLNYYGNFPKSPELIYRIGNEKQLRRAQEELRIISNYRKSHEYKV